MKSKLIYRGLLILINVFGFFFLGLIFLGSFSVSPEAANPLNEQQVLIRKIIYGLGVSLVFSLASLLVSVIFRKRLSFDWNYLKRFFLMQFLLLLLVYAIIYFFIQLK